MRSSIRVLSTVAILGFMVGSVHAAESKAVQTMARILLDLQHVPSADAKQVLGQIAADESATAHERTIAKALMNVQHKISAADKASLEAIANDAKASSGEKTLASVMLSLNHFPSASDKEKLAVLSQ